MHSRFGAYRLMVKTITMTALLFLAGVGAVLWLMPYEWLWIVLPAVTLLLCAVSVALYWYEVRLPIGRMIASMQAMREGQAVTLDDARRDDEFGQLARAIVEFSIRNQHHLEEVRRRKDDFQRLFDMVPCGISVQDREYRLLRWNHSFAVRYDPQPGNTCYEVYKGRTTPCPECSVQRTMGGRGRPVQSGKPRQPRRDAGLLVRADRAPVRQGRQRVLGYGNEHRHDAHPYPPAPAARRPSAPTRPFSTVSPMPSSSWTPPNSPSSTATPLPSKCTDASGKTN